MDAVVVVQADPGGDGDFHVGARLPGPAGISSSLNAALTDSVRVLSYESATELADAAAPISASRSVYRMERY